MLFKKPDHKKFDYTPIYYKPEKDPDVKMKERIRFRGRYGQNKHARKRIVFYAILFLLILYLLKKLAIFG
jgi:hypothetical protein